MRWTVQRHGQATVELALTLPLLLFVTLATIIIGHMLYARTVVMLAAHQGARLGAVLYGESPPPSDARSQVENKAITILNASLRGVDRTVAVQEMGDDLVVTVTYQYAITVPWIADLFQGGRVPISMKATYRIERQG